MVLTWRRMAGIVAGLLAGSFGIQVGAAAAEEFMSRYTSTAPKACKVIQRSKPSDGDWTVWSCAGPAGDIVLLTEDDLRVTVSVGRDVAAAEKEPAASQGFAPFNRVSDSVEWRGLKGASRPFAMIQRWMISDSENPDRTGRPTPVGLLVVTRLPPGPVCHVAYIDVGANPEPNALARRAADETARAYDCKNAPAIIGQRGRAIAVALP